MEKHQAAIYVALQALYSMITAEQSYPQGNCKVVPPTPNICHSCIKHAFCSNRQRFLEQMDYLENMAGD